MNNCEEIKDQFNELTDLVSKFQADLKSGKKKNAELKKDKEKIIISKRILVEAIFTSDYQAKIIKEKILTEIKEKVPECDYEVIEDNVGDLVYGNGEVLLKIVISENSYTGKIGLLFFRYKNAPYFDMTVLFSEDNECSDNQNKAYNEFVSKVAKNGSIIIGEIYE